MEFFLGGIVGGGAALLVSKSGSFLRPAKRSHTKTNQPLSSMPSPQTCGLKEVVASIRELFAECRAEEEAIRIAIEEVRNPSSSKVVRIY